MPWTTDGNGDPKYILSKYAKEELPTWNEVYNEFYVAKNFNYDPDDSDDQANDNYWGIPRSKVLLATICNQFNKMLKEDGYIKPLIEYTRGCINSEIVDIRFTCTEIPTFEDYLVTNGPLPIESADVYELYLKFTEELWTPSILSTNIGTDDVSPIYTIPLPTGKPNPFIISDIPRIDVKELKGEVSIVPIIMGLHKNDEDEEEPIYWQPTPHDPDCNDWYLIVDFMMRPFKEYFENGVGWKDKDGNLIDSEPAETACIGVGFDPAL